MRTKPYATSILVFDEVELLDVTGPLAVLSAAGRQWNFQPFKIDLVASHAGFVSTRSNLRLEVSRPLAREREVEVLLVPGGYGARRAAEDEAVLSWLRESAARAEIVGAIGNGVWLLAKAGLLDEHEVAATPELAAELAQEFPSVRANGHAALCSSGATLSARVSALGLDLSCEIVSRCFGKKLASTLSTSLGIDWAGELGALDIVPGPLLVK